MSGKAKICIIDDNVDNLDLLEQELVDAGYDVVTATDGSTGLQVITDHRPDLLLLDLMMPGLSGYEVCRRLRADNATAALPIIMVTAKSGAENEVLGLDIGGNDYLTKPINIQTLLARVRTQLRIKSLQDEIQRNYEAFMRADQSRRAMASMLTHDLKTPLMTVTASTKMMLDEETRKDSTQCARLAGLILRSAQKMQELVDDSLSLSRWEHSGLEVHFEVCNLREIVEDIAALFRALLTERKISLTMTFPEEAPLVYVDPVLIGRVFQNLLSNAIKYNHPGGEITFTVEIIEDRVACQMRDTGIGIPAKVLPRVFDSYYRPAESKEIEGSGLGLAVVQAILQAHQSEHSIESEEGQGTVFRFALRRTRPGRSIEAREERHTYRAIRLSEERAASAEDSD